MDDQAPAPEAQNAPAVEDNSPAPSPAVEPTTSEPTNAPVAQEPSTDDTAVAAPVAEEPAAEPERQPSRAERRIQQLTGQLKELSSPQQATVPIPQVSPQAPKLSEQFAGKEYIDPAELDAAGQKVYESAAQTAQGRNTLEVQQLRHELTQQRAVDEVEKDASILPTQYEELNPDSPKYNAVLEDKIEAAYKARAVVTNPYNPSVRMVDPSVRLADVAKDFIDVARAAAEQGKAQTTATLAQQQDTSAITPTSDTPVEKSLDSMSLDEHEQYLKSKGYDI